MQMKNKNLKRRILDISYKHKLSHLGSCLSALDIIQDIYNTKKDDEPFILSQGHAGLALYVVMEAIFPRVNAEEFLEVMGIHPERGLDINIDEFIDCSTGSLGQGLPIAVGMALADRTKNVYCLISDGECAEGSIWEALKIAYEQKLTNLKIYVNTNGFSGYGRTDKHELLKRLTAFDVPFEWNETNVDYLPFLAELDGHYKVMTAEEYQLALRSLDEQN